MERTAPAMLLAGDGLDLISERKTQKMENMHLKVMFFTRPDGQLCLMIAGKDDAGQRLAITAYPPKGANIKEYIEGMVTAAIEERKTRASQKSANFKS